jgi:hypothetical protein
LNRLRFVTQDPRRSGRALTTRELCADGSRRPRDVKKRTNRLWHVSRGRNKEMNGPRWGLEFVQ